MPGTGKRAGESCEGDNLGQRPRDKGEYKYSADWRKDPVFGWPEQVNEQPGWLEAHKEQDKDKELTSDLRQSE